MDLHKALVVQVAVVMVVHHLLQLQELQEMPLLEVLILAAVVVAEVHLHQLRKMVQQAVAVS